MYEKEKQVDKTAFRVVAIIAVCIVLLIMSLDSMLDRYVEKQAKKALSSMFEDYAGFKSVKVDVFSARARIKGFYIKYPPEYGQGDIIRVSYVLADLSLSDLYRKSRVLFSDISIKGVKVNINSAAAAALFKTKETSSSVKKESSMAVILQKVTLKKLDLHLETPEHELNLAGVGLELAGLYNQGANMRLGNGELFIRSAGFNLKGDKPVSLELEDIKLECENIVKGEAVDNAPMKAALTGTISYGEYPDGYTGAYLHGKNENITDLVFNITGFELDPLNPLLPPGAYAVIGGDAIDISGQIRKDSGTVSGIVETDSIHGKKLELKIIGDVYNPQIDTSSPIFLILSRMGSGIGGAVTSTVSRVTGAPVDVADSALGIGKGVVKSVKGIATADVKDAVGGLGDLTGGTAKKLGQLLTGKGKGKEKDETWRAAKKSRWKKDFGSSKERLIQELSGTAGPAVSTESK